MGIFTIEFAVILQYFTFPLEVRFPDQAHTVASAVKFQDERTTIESFSHPWKSSTDYTSFRYKVILLVALILISLVVAPSITMLILISGITIFLMIRLTNRWVPERAVGTLGIIIAVFGVLGEGHQFTAQLLLA
ncbi:MAG: hypothetical protein O2971_13140 [Proteobacteria bacterium]|nr:hypothetical protein [Pseudomonadota bacterium]